MNATKRSGLVERDASVRCGIPGCSLTSSKGHRSGSRSSDFPRAHHWPAFSAVVAIIHFFTWCEVAFANDGPAGLDEPVASAADISSVARRTSLKPLLRRAALKRPLNADENTYSYSIYQTRVASRCPVADNRLATGRCDHPSTLLVEEDFNAQPTTSWGALPSNWWLEGEQAGARARIQDGRLLMDAVRNGGTRGTLWLDRELPEEVRLTFDVHVVESIEDANNMNLFLHFRDAHNDTLRSTRQDRSSAKYNQYHSSSLSGTIITYLANGSPRTARLRVRSVPPFEPVIYEFEGYHARQGQTYHFTFTRENRRLSVEIDGRMLAEVDVPTRNGVIPGGYLGFRTWRTKLWWDNLVITTP